MNFDSLKEAWNSGQEPTKPFSENDLKLKASHSFIDLIKKHIRLEFYISLTIIISLGIIMYFLKMNANQLSVCTTALSLLIIISVFYYRRFYKFYKNSATLSFNTRDNLMWFYYEMKLNVEMYRSYCTLTFFMILFALAQLDFDKPSYFSNGVMFIRSQSLFVKIAIFLFWVILFIAGMEYWINQFYGKYIRKIKSILDEL